jgi:hypothetical protein
MVRTGSEEVSIFKGLSSEALTKPFYEWVWTPGSKVRKMRKENEGKVFAISYYDYPETCCGDSAQS